jgi:uncharacterized coiled-coil DUF342 family protein
LVPAKNDRGKEGGEVSELTKEQEKELEYLSTGVGPSCDMAREIRTLRSKLEEAEKDREFHKWEAHELKAKLQQTEAENKKLREDVEKTRSAWDKDHGEFVVAFDRASNERDTLREALEKYAQEDWWYQDQAYIYNIFEGYDGHGYEIAQQALEKLGNRDVDADGDSSGG